MHVLLFTVLITLPINTGLNLDITLTALRCSKATPEPFADLLNVSFNSVPCTPVRQVNCTEKQVSEQTRTIKPLNEQQQFQLALDLIIRYNTHCHLAGKESIWEIAEDIYLINLVETSLYVIKCRVKQAIYFTATHILMFMSSVPLAWGTFDRKSILFKLIVKFF